MVKHEPIITEAFREHNERHRALLQAAEKDPRLKPFLDAYRTATPFPVNLSEYQREIAEEAAHELIQLAEDILDELVTELVPDA